MRMVDLIAKKRDGGSLSPEEIRYFVQGYADKKIPDYQAAAMLMAIYLKDLNLKETRALIEAMLHSGETIDLSAIQGIKVDKHSTGGVGDKTTLVLGPMVAACGVPVAKMSGRGLGHTGGTIDKLESFPGFSVEMDRESFLDQVNKIGIALSGQSGNIVPADKQMYALRDVTATVAHIPLIAGSIMSKKLASGADAIVLDVKCGSGAFMKTLPEAEALARLMVDVGNSMGRKTMALVTNMSQPLGRAVGNALEAKEAIDTLKGKGPKDLFELCIALSSRMVWLGGAASSAANAEAMLRKTIENGSALAKFRELIEAQGGDASFVDDPEKLPIGKYEAEWKAEESGFVTELLAEPIGRAAMLLGAGRQTKTDALDLGAGIYLHKKIGDQVRKGDKLATLYASKKNLFAAALKRLESAITIEEKAPLAKPLIIQVVD